MRSLEPIGLALRVGHKQQKAGHCPAFFLRLQPEQTALSTINISHFFHTCLFFKQPMLA